MRLQRTRAAPVQQPHRCARAQLHRIRRQHLGLDLQLGRIANLHQRLSHRHRRGALQRALEHHARRRRHHGHRLPAGRTRGSVCHACTVLASGRTGLLLPQCGPGFLHPLSRCLRLGLRCRQLCRRAGRLRLGLLQRLLRHHPPLVQPDGALQTAARQATGRLGCLHPLPCRPVLAASRCQLGLGPAVTTSVQQNWRSRINPRHHLPCLHRIPGLQRHTPQLPRHGCGQRIARLQPRLAFFRKALGHRGMSSLFHMGQLHRLA